MPDNDLAPGQVGVPPWKLKDLSRLSRDWSSQAVSIAIRAVARADEQVKVQLPISGFALEQLLRTVDQARQAGRAR